MASSKHPEPPPNVVRECVGRHAADLVAARRPVVALGRVVRAGRLSLSISTRPSVNRPLAASSKPSGFILSESLVVLPGLSSHDASAGGPASPAAGRVRPPSHRRRLSGPAARPPTSSRPIDLKRGILWPDASPDHFRRTDTDGRRRRWRRRRAGQPAALARGARSGRRKRARWSVLPFEMPAAPLADSSGPSRRSLSRSKDSPSSPT
jgi:hypothetical protein